ncbi:N-formylglutamate amidohydrolase [Sphingomonas cavernae]|uniref:N-formylglutamate amidohydrolase n=1 Tax=Sphingomonas cavernae TaxID=2320861 RepID=A0A418W649_9SPHN|nr:N-formylglutamate amidohydrolase [Sphingomonas cavernae]RJF85513.1 N-formylglutamate amidohydrolase [Sphingomonas cavernae]
MTPHHVAGNHDSGLLIIVDHASNHVPEDVDLGIPAELLGEHMAIDIGTWDLCHRLAERLSAPALLATVSRLVVDLNREADHNTIIPLRSDGHEIPGNIGLNDDERHARIARFWHPYHDDIARRITDYAPAMLVSLHSFTPSLRSDPDQKRPWQIGVLYNGDDRAARIAIPAFEAAGVVTGDNLPYSGKVLNATMNRHAEGNHMPYLGIEVRQDLISDPAGVERWADIIAPIIAETRNGVASGRAFGT